MFPCLIGYQTKMSIFGHKLICFLFLVNFFFRLTDSSAVFASSITIEFERVRFDSEEVELIRRDNLLEIETILSESRVGLDIVKHSNDILDEVVFDEESFRTYLRQFDVNQFDSLDQYNRFILFKTNIRKHIAKVSFKELKVGINRMAKKFNEIIGENSYGVGYVEKKSSSWISSLVMPYLKTLPKFGWKHNVDTDDDDEDSRSMQLSGAADLSETIFVIFDDISYSGMQLESILLDFCRRIEDSTIQDAHLYVFIPFMSTRSEDLMNVINSRARDYDGLKNIKISVFSTDFSFTCIGDFSIKEDVMILQGRDDLAANYGSFGRGACMLYTDWKIPDSESLVGWLNHVYATPSGDVIARMGQQDFVDLRDSRFFKFLPDIIPPYKR